MTSKIEVNLWRR